jgi:hypothetical protein
MTELEVGAEKLVEKQHAEAPTKPCSVEAVWVRRYFAYLARSMMERARKSVDAASFRNQKHRIRV